MEGRLCCCGEGKGKGRQVLEEIPLVLGSPLILGHSSKEGHTSDNSYHTPPLASSLVPTSSSPIKSNKENMEEMSSLVEIVDGSLDYNVPLPVPAPVLNLARFQHLLAVCGQRAVRRLGPPKSLFHPYACCRSIGDRSTTHQPGASCACSRFRDQTGTLLGWSSLTVG